jgi:hypothetical protein
MSEESTGKLRLPWTDVTRYREHEDRVPRSMCVVVPSLSVRVSRHTDLDIQDTHVRIICNGAAEFVATVKASSLEHGMEQAEQLILASLKKRHARTLSLLKLLGE